MKNLTTSTKISATRSNRTMHGVKLAAVVAACVGFSACGAIAEKVTEEGAERIIESESGENVDLDFNSGDGSFSVKTEDGSFAVNEDGEFVVTDADGSVFSGSASDDGIVVLDADGNPVLNVSGDGESGQLSVQGDSGEDFYRVVTAIPDEWPSDIPRPTKLKVDAGSYASFDGEILMTLIGAPDSGDAVAYTKAYSAALLAAGLTETGRFDSSSNGSTNMQRTYENDKWVVNITGYNDASTGAFNISVVSQTE